MGENLQPICEAANTFKTSHHFSILKTTNGHLPKESGPAMRHAAAGTPEQGFYVLLIPYGNRQDLISEFLWLLVLSWLPPSSVAAPAVVYRAGFQLLAI